MFNFKNKKVLCLSPHPDDAEIAISGTVLKFPDIFFDILTLSCGSENDNMQGNSRHNEIINFWNILGVENINLILPKVNYITELREDQWITEIEKNYNLDINSYDCIMTTPKNDNHCEHRIVNNISRSLVRSSNCMLLEYQTVSVQPDWVCNLSIDIQEQFENKTTCLEKAFANQLNNGRRYFGRKSMEMFSKDFKLMRKNIEYVEKYRLIEGCL